MSASTTSAASQWPAAKVRSTFIEYFEKNGHTFGQFRSYKHRLVNSADVPQFLQLLSYLTKIPPSSSSMPE